MILKRHARTIKKGWSYQGKLIINKKHVFTNSLSSKPIISILSIQFKFNAIQQDLVVSPNNIITVSFFKISNQ